MALLIIVLSLPVIAWSQDQRGTIQYKEKVKLEFKIEGPMSEALQNMPKERISGKVLYFSPEASLNKKAEQENDNNEKEIMQSGKNIRITMTEPDNRYFIDLNKKKTIEQREFMTRKFLISGDLPENNWKIIGEQEEILDYPCMEAIKTDTSGVITRVWFTPAINIPAGPSEYCNLPGMVLKVDIDNGKRIIEATNINFDDPGDEVFEKPKKGKKVTKEEFDKIVAEKMEEMEAQGTTKGATVVIKIRK